MLAIAGATILRPPPTAGPFARDFEAYYAAGATWNAGGDPWSRDVWNTERTIRGVDASRDELLPFIGPAPALPLWSVFARLPFDVARKIWTVLLGLALILIAVCAAALAHVRLTLVRSLSTLLFCALTMPVKSDIALGQIALASAAAVALALVLLERRSPWAIAATVFGAFQPNLVLPLAVRLVERRAALYLAAAAAIFIAIALVVSGGAEGFAIYLHRLAEHGAAERFILIQYNVPAIGASLHLPAGAAELAGNAVSVAALASVAIAAVRLRENPRYAAAVAIALLPLVVPFFHQHDFTIELIPAVLLTASANARVRAIAGAASVLVFCDWLGAIARPDAAVQTACLGLAIACAIVALPNRSLRAASPWPPLAAWAVLTAIAVPLTHFFPGPVWPDTLGAFHAPPNLDAAAVWAAEQQRAGLDAFVPAWGVIRAIPLLGCAAFAAAAYFAAEPVAITTRPPRTASGTAVSESP